MKLPPLNALRAFDATARHLSVRHAADELFVTPGAVSQQLKLLEQWLGQRLLDRGSRGIRLTATGASFHAATHRHLRAIAAAAILGSSAASIRNLTDAVPWSSSRSRSPLSSQASARTRTAAL
jgi:LysR family glycine cleavage system transcriptional activator